MGGHMALLADAQQRAGDRAAALRTAERAIAYGAERATPWVEGRALRVLGRIAQADGDPAVAEDRLRSALSTFEAAGAGFEVARTQLELAQVALTRGDSAEARRLAAEAGEAFHGLRVPAWAERARALAARLGGS
jgi:hypothetical protein